MEAVLNRGGEGEIGVDGSAIMCKGIHLRDFPGGTVVKNPAANAGDTGSSPGPGRSHMPQSN